MHLTLLSTESTYTLHEPYEHLDLTAEILSEKGKVFDMFWFGFMMISNKLHVFTEEKTLKHHTLLTNGS